MFKRDVIPQNIQDITQETFVRRTQVCVQCLLAPSQHHHYSCSQSLYHSPADGKRLYNEHQNDKHKNEQINGEKVQHLQQHVSWLYSPIRRHSSSLHNRADVDASISPLITLTNNTDAQEIIFILQRQRARKLHKIHARYSQSMYILLHYEHFQIKTKTHKYF